MVFEIIIDFRAEEEIDQSIQYLYERNKNTSKKLYKQILESIEHLSVSPNHSIRYDNIRCLPIKGFPYMIHYSIKNQKSIVMVHAFIHTSKNPKTSWLNK